MARKNYGIVVDTPVTEKPVEPVKPAVEPKKEEAKKKEAVKETKKETED